MYKAPLLWLSPEVVMVIGNQHCPAWRPEIPATECGSSFHFSTLIKEWEGDSLDCLIDYKSLSLEMNN